MSDELRATNDELRVQAQLAVYWMEYSILQQTLQRIEKRALKRWGEQVVTPVMTTAVTMKQLRQELEALEVGFGE